jgi:hypothetical protein
MLGELVLAERAGERPTIVEMSLQLDDARPDEGEGLEPHELHASDLGPPPPRTG